MFKKMLAKRQAQETGLSQSQATEVTSSQLSTQATESAAQPWMSSQSSETAAAASQVQTQANSNSQTQEPDEPSATQSPGVNIPRAPKKAKLDSDATKFRGDLTSEDISYQERKVDVKPGPAGKVHVDTIRMWDASHPGLGSVLHEFVRIEEFALGRLMYKCLMCDLICSKQTRKNETFTAIARHVNSECRSRKSALASNTTLLKSMLQLKRMMEDIKAERRKAVKQTDKKKTKRVKKPRKNVVESLVTQRNAAIISTLADFVVDTDMKAHSVEWQPLLRSFVRDILECAHDKGLTCEDVSMLSAKQLNAALKQVKNRVVLHGQVLEDTS